MYVPKSEPIRFFVEPRDVPPKQAARRLYLTEQQFRDHLPGLIERGFPKPDPTTGNFDLKRIDEWMDTRRDGDSKPAKSDYSHLVGLSAAA